MLVGSPGDNASRHELMRYEIGEGALARTSLDFLFGSEDSARKGPLREQSGASCNLG